MKQILTEQVDAAVAMNPTLVRIYAGINDILRPKVDIDGMVEKYDAGDRPIGGHRRHGADVHRLRRQQSSNVFPGSAVGPPSTTNWSREVADTHGACWWTLALCANTTTGGCGTMTACTCPRPGTSTWPTGCWARSKPASRQTSRRLAPMPELKPLEQLRANAQWTRETRARGSAAGCAGPRRLPLPRPVGTLPPTRARQCPTPRVFGHCRALVGTRRTGSAIALPCSVVP